MWAEALASLVIQQRALTVLHPSRLMSPMQRPYLGVKQVRRGVRSALGVGAALIAMAAVCGARADVVPIDVDECSTSCVSPTSDDEAESAGDITLSLSGGGGAGDPSRVRPDLIFDSIVLPPVLVSGLPSAIMSVGARALDNLGVSPYAFFEDVIDVPDSAGARALTAVASTPSLTSELRDFLWASNDFFGPPSGDTASRRGLPVSVDAGYLTGRLTTGWTMRTRVTPTLSPSPLSGPPSSSATEPFGQVGDETGRSVFSSDSAESNK